MTLDDLIETLEALRARYPSAGTAHVDCPVEIDPWYELGEVQLGFEWVAAEDDGDDAPVPPLVH